MKNNLLLLGLIILCISCTKQFPASKFVQNKTFSDNDTKELLQLLASFDNTIVEIEKKSNPMEAYDSFFKKMKDNTNNKGIIDVGISLEKQKELEKMVNKNLSKELWSNMYSLKRKDSIRVDSIAKPVLNPKGQFMNFLSKEVAKDDQTIANAVKKIQMAGDISPSLFADMTVNYKNYNISDDRIRLMMAIHYLAINRGSLNEKKYLAAQG